MQNVGLFLVFFIPFGHHVKIPMNWQFKARLRMFLIGYVSGYCANYNTIIGAMWTQKSNSLRCQDNSMPCFLFKRPPGILFERNLCCLLPFQESMLFVSISETISINDHSPWNCLTYVSCKYEKLKMLMVTARSHCFLKPYLWEISTQNTWKSKSQNILL